VGVIWKFYNPYGKIFFMNFKIFNNFLFKKKLKFSKSSGKIQNFFQVKENFKFLKNSKNYKFYLFMSHNYLTNFPLYRYQPELLQISRESIKNRTWK
jgi:hypothetical protein